ncbi:MAG TPA: DEAD/DEAH box helicase family protein, partial [Pyrinomonadaceae bacterium]|nr:DEAD/DEAH box helicase family protein [Pyrinomonadaceae bacterium]
MKDKQKDWLQEALGLGQGETAFPWQEELLRRFLEGKIERSLDIPTGLGKTAVMAIWLVARALGAALPRRLAYVVDRRAVVDQATQVAINLREFVERSPQMRDSLDLKDRPLPLSTLRGQYVDNKEWLENPASPAIIV